MWELVEFEDEGMTWRGRRWEEMGGEYQEWGTKGGGGLFRERYEICWAYENENNIPTVRPFLTL